MTTLSVLSFHASSIFFFLKVRSISKELLIVIDDMVVKL